MRKRAAYLAEKHATTALAQEGTFALGPAAWVASRRSSRMEIRDRNPSSFERLVSLSRTATLTGRPNRLSPIRFLDLRWWAAFELRRAWVEELRTRPRRIPGLEQQVAIMGIAAAKTDNSPEKSAAPGHLRVSSLPFRQKTMAATPTQSVDTRATRLRLR